MLILSAIVEGACGTLGTDLTRVIALNVTVADSVRQADTLRAHASALTAAGDTVPATIFWASLDTAYLAVADSAAGVFVGKKVGTARLQARTGNLRWTPIAIRVTAKP